MKAIMQAHAGGPEMLQIEEVQVPSPGPGEVVVAIAAAGVNFMDIGTRLGMYSIGAFPTTPGVEGSGRVTAVGVGVTALAVGDRVAWFFVPRSYAEYVVGNADSFVRLPDDIADDTAASVMMQGLTSLNFVRGTYKIQPGDTALVHAAAGGVGLLLTQMIKILGGRVVARVSAPSKVDVARRAGADHVIVAPSGGFADEVRAWSGGEGVHVVYDGSGADTFSDSVASLRHYGVLAYYGQTIKRLPPIDLLDLPRSILVTYPVVQHLVRSHAALGARSSELFDWLRSGKLRVEIGGRYPLAEAARAHRDLESRRTIGKLLLIP